MTDRPNRKLQGKVTFVQNAMPALKAGEYELKISQHLEGAHGANAVDDTLVEAARFTVRGERFSLDPGEVHSVFPADNAFGEYASVLPHVVFTRATLPWERTPFAAAQPPSTAGQNVPAWLAVLSIDDADLTHFPGFDPIARPAKVGELFQPALGSLVSAFGAHAAAAELDLGESVADPCSILDMPLALFRAVAPTLADLGLVAHARSVTPENQERAPGADEVGERFSVVVGNRLPSPARKTRAYLVSLEGLEPWLPGGVRQDDGVIRLVVLKSWTFTAIDQTQPGADFVNLLREVDVAVLARKPAGASSDATADSAVKQALALGYVPLAHDTRGGSRMVSWFRGPLQPNPKRRELRVPISSADAALRYDPDTGLLDVSYAAAWQLGRLLAVQDKAFSTALYGWRREVERQLVTEAASAAAHAPFAPLLAGAPAEELPTRLLAALKDHLE